MPKNKSSTLKILDKYLKLVNEIDGFSELYYTRRLIEPGDFGISIPLNLKGADDLDIGNYVLIGDGGTRLGVIESIEKKRLKKGKNWIIARGHEAKALFGRRITIPANGDERIILNGPAETVMKALIEGQCGNKTTVERILPVIKIGSDLKRGADYTLSSRLSNLQTELCRCAKASEIGYTVYLNTENKKMIFEVIIGTNRSAEQDDNPRVFIAENYDTMKLAEIKKGYIGLCNTLYVEGQKSPEGWPVVAAWQDSEPYGEGRFERAIDAPLIQDEELLHSYGISKLSSYQGEFFLEAEVLPNAPLLPDEDYFLGDVCSVDAYGQWYTVRLESIEERWTNEGPGIRLGFGQPAMGSHSAAMRETESLWEMLRSG